MHKLVSAVNELQNVLMDVGWEPLELPRVVLAGARGSGKSSVLEGLIGEPVIPETRRTRRPLVLQLINFPEESDADEAWVEFVHRPNRVFKDFEAVGREILAETERLAGRHTDICTLPILMKFYSSKVMNFTMVDLPGLDDEREGDSPTRSDTAIRNHVMKHIANENSIILAVVAADTDVRSSEIIQLARQADPGGSRTLCVLTKVDLMDAGTNSAEILLGNAVDFKIAIIGTIYRSQKDISNGVTIRDVLDKEKTLLERRFKPFSDRHGTSYLCEKIYETLVRRIKLILPEVHERIREDPDGYDTDLLPFGNYSIDSQEDLLCFLTGFVAAYADSVSGTCKNIGTRELEGGARIAYIFQEVYGRALNSLDAMEGYDSRAVLTALKNSSGTKPCLFVPQHCFERLVKKQIARLVEPSVRCVTLVQEELVRMSYRCDWEIARRMEGLPKLRAKVFNVLTGLVKSRLAVTVEMVENVIEMHTAYINTAHPDFLDRTSAHLSLYREEADRKALETAVRGTRSNPADTDVVLEKLLDECFLIESMIKSYFDIIRKSVADAVPKIIMHFMVNHVSDHLLTELVASVYSDGDPTALLEEPPIVVARKEIAEANAQSLRRAEKVIENFMKLQ